MKPHPLLTIQQFLKARHKDASSVFWAGSVANDTSTAASDLDLVIVYEHIPNAYRETSILENWPIDAFIHDKETLRYFFEESKNISGISGLMHMILYGKEITPFSAFSESIKAMASSYLKAGPTSWSKDQIDTQRFLLTDTLEDIEIPGSPAEQIASAAHFYEALGHFYFRAQGKWSANGKMIFRYLIKDNPTLAQRFSSSFERLFQTGETEPIKQLTESILDPYGGLLWNHFQSQAPEHAKRVETDYSTLEILPASIEDYLVIQNMARFYLYDMSKFCHQDSKDWAIPEDGLYVCNDFKSYFEAADRKAYLGNVPKVIVGLQKR